MYLKRVVHTTTNSILQLNVEDLKLIHKNNRGVKNSDLKRVVRLMSN